MSRNSATTSKPRQVSAVFWPTSSRSSGARETLEKPALLPAPHPVIWGDWPRCSDRRHWVQLLRSQTVILPATPVQQEIPKDRKPPEKQTRSQRAHWRLSWNERLARNARSSSAPPLAITLHGLPATFAQVFGFALVAAA